MCELVVTVSHYRTLFLVHEKHSGSISFQPHGYEATKIEKPKVIDSIRKLVKSRYRCQDIKTEEVFDHNLT